MPLVPSEICNMALGHLGVKDWVINFQTDTSTEAECCRTYYYQAVREMLEDFPWPFATIFAPLNLIENCFSREREYAYAYPPNCIIIRRLFSKWGFNRNDDVQSRQKFKIIQTPNPAVPAVAGQPAQMMKVILADMCDLQVEYTGDDQIVSDFSPGFKKALSFLLAAYIAPQLTGGDPYKLGDRAAMEFKQALATAETHASNEEVDDPVRLGEFIDQRGPDGGWLRGGPWQAYPASQNI